MANAKVTLNGVTLIDLTSDSVVASALRSGYTAHKSDGTSITGTIINGSATTPSTTISVSPSFSLNTTTGVITATVSKSQSITPTVTTGYVSNGTGGTVTANGSSSYSLSIAQGTTVTPTESEQTAVASGKYLVGAIKVGAISSTYVGSGVVSHSSGDISVSSYTVTAPSGYYASDATYTLSSGILSEINLSIDNTGVVTGSVNASGYFPNLIITERSLALSTVAGKTVTPTETRQLAVGSSNFTTGPVYVGAISSDYIGSNIATRSAADLTASGSYINVPSGYYSAAASKNVGAGSAKTPATTITANPTVTINSSTGLITATVSKSQNITPTITTGYVSSGTAGSVKASGSNTLQLTVIGATTYTPTTTDQTIASGRYLTGVQTIKGDSNLVASNIAEGVTIFGITGTHSGSSIRRIVVQETLLYLQDAYVERQNLYTFGSVNGATLIL